VNIQQVDGTVNVNTGGIEMGQGFWTKMTQVAATVFYDMGVPARKINLYQTNTDLVPNQSSTAASYGNDMYGPAVKDACMKLRAKIKPNWDALRAEFPEATPWEIWQKAVAKTYTDRVSLSDVGFYKVPGLTEYTWGQNNAPSAPYAYCTSGAAVSEVEVDCLTGDSRTVRSDVILGFGNSLNPQLDAGQIEGAFTQGVGLFNLEEVIWGGGEMQWVKPGQCYTRGPRDYKIPSFDDMPTEFCVSQLAGHPNQSEGALYKSRAVGEPPLFLGCSVYWANHMAIMEARKANGKPATYFQVGSPMSTERIRMAMGDDIADAFENQGGLNRPAISLAS